MSLPLYDGEVPHLTTGQMIEVDRAMVEDYHVELMQMMENAGRNLAHLARDRFLDGDAEGKPVVVLAGTVGNGGGALVAARRLHNWGARVQVVLAQPMDKLTPVPAHQFDILTRMRVPVLAAEEIDSITTPAVVLDGLIGYSLRGAPQGAAAELIRWANSQRAPILALDVPDRPLHEMHARRVLQAQAEQGMLDQRVFVVDRDLGALDVGANDRQHGRLLPRQRHRAVEPVLKEVPQRRRRRRTSCDAAIDAEIGAESLATGDPGCQSCFTSAYPL